MGLTAIIAVDGNILLGQDRGSRIGLIRGIMDHRRIGADGPYGPYGPVLLSYPQRFFFFGLSAVCP
jgi:hypothetical protein